MIVVAIIGILAAIAIPQYQTFIAKSQVSRAIGEAGALKTAIEDCLNNGKLTAGTYGTPTTAATECDLGATESNIINTGYPSVPANGGTLTSTQQILVTFGGSASTALTDGTPATISWDRTANGSWECTSTAAPKFNTAACPN